MYLLHTLAENQKILLATLNFLAEQLPSNHNKTDDSE